MKTYHGDISEAVARPWEVKHHTQDGAAYVKGADGTMICTCNANNAELIVKAVNAYKARERKAK